MRNLKIITSFGLIIGLLTACTTSINQATESSAKGFKRDLQCNVNHNIERHPIPSTPNNMSLPSFGQGVIGWGTGPEGAKLRLENVIQADIQDFKVKGATLEMVKEWQAFYENEVKRNPCNPTAVYRAALMKKITLIWVI